MSSSSQRCPARAVRSAATAGLLVLLPACGSLIVTSRGVDELVHRPGFEWTTHETSRASVRAEATAATAGSLPAIARVAAEVVDEYRTLLGLTDDAPPVTCLLVADRERMRALIGRRTNATAYPASNLVVLVWPRTGRAGLRHELAHVIVTGAWGAGPRWLDEGLATDLAGPWGSRELDQLARALREQGELPTPERLRTRFGSLPSAVAYPAAGSFVRFVRERHGLDAVRSWWTVGPGAVRVATGRTPDELESGWLAELDALAWDGESYDWAARTPDDDR